MRLPFRSSGAAGWVLLALGVIGWDVLAPETMSSAFRRATATPGGFAAVTGATAVIVAHLYEVLPEDKDPLRHLQRVGFRPRLRAGA